MFWVIQQDLFQHNQRHALIETLERFDIPHQVVNVESDGTLDPDVVYDGPIITNGSILLSKIAIRRGWSPGSLFNENFSYDVWMPHFKDHMLNRDAILTTYGEAEPEMDEFFVRPLNDEKSLTGKVYTRDEFRQLNLPANTPILYAPVKYVGQEHRHFIVDGKVISSSLYKMNGEPTQNSMVDPYVVEFARQMAMIWQPARAFVLDTYIAGDIGIVEMGCICHAGFYQADVQKIVMALNEIS